MARAAVSRIRESQNRCKVCAGIWSIFAAQQHGEADVPIDSLFESCIGFVSLFGALGSRITRTLLCSDPLVPGQHHTLEVQCEQHIEMTTSWMRSS